MFDIKRALVTFLLLGDAVLLIYIFWKFDDISFQYGILWAIAIVLTAAFFAVRGSQYLIKVKNSRDTTTNSGDSEDTIPN